MKKKILLCLVLLAILFGGCTDTAQGNVSSENVSSENISSDNASSDTSSEKITTQNEVEAKQTKYEQTLAELKKSTVTEIVISYVVSPSPYEGKELTIRDSDLIKRWVDLISEMDVEARTVEYTSGFGFSLQFKADDKGLSFGGFMLPYIYGGYEDKTMLYVCNYEELKPKINQLKKDSGIPSSEY